MKIAIIQGAFFPVPPLRGGAVEKLWHGLAAEFSRLGHTVTHISRRFDGLPDTETTHGVAQIRVAGYDQPAGGAAMKFLDLLYSRRACRALPASDIVITNTFWSPLFLRRRPGVYVSVQRMPKGQMRLYRKADRLHACSSAVRDMIVQEDPASAPRVVMIPNPLPNSPTRPVAWERKEKTILFVGRIHPEKGIELLLRAFVAAKAAGGLAGWQLRLIGPSGSDGGGGGTAWRDDLQGNFARPDVEWLPPEYDAARLAEHYERASLFVYPSLAERGETFGVAPLEAMAWGTVPIVSALACFRDFIVPEQNGFVFDHRAPDAVSVLADALARAAGAPLRPLAETGLAVRATHAVPRIAEEFLRDFNRVHQMNVPA